MNVALLIAALLLVSSILASKITGRFGIPGLLLFLIIGMLAGSDGPGGIPFEDYALTQFVGVIALVYILYGGGLETRWRDVKPVLGNGISLATIGVLVTTFIVGVTATILFNLSFLEGLLMGAIVSSTDASAVFTVLKERALGLKGQIRPLLEFESGSNDPMAVFLTVGFITLLQNPMLPWYSVVPTFFQQMVLGVLFGLLLGRLAVVLINRVSLSFEGLYAVLSLALALLIYALTAVLGGSGFLAVYVAAMVMGNSEFIHKRSVLQFHDGVSWLVGIGMFLILGLLVYPHQLVPLIFPSLALALVLIFIARPISVYLSLISSKMSVREKGMVAWVGLRGAVPITLATFPLLAGVEDAQLMFNVTFFLVLSSVLIQSTSLPFVARLLGVRVPLEQPSTLPLDYTPTGRNRNDLVELTIPDDSVLVGQRIVDAHLPPEALVVLMLRQGEYIIPRGATELEARDTIQVLGSKIALAELQEMLQRKARVALREESHEEAEEVANTEVAVRDEKTREGPEKTTKPADETPGDDLENSVVPKV
jgi:potassium/hydrogen antiporter